MSQALYRQYRPQRFDDVVGQDVAVRTLRNAIEQDRVAHAYLFTGTKGTGKTTLAKLLAKAMNCDNGPTTDPCGTCESCVAIAEGRSMDVAEIDAASNTGIDHVREKIIDTVAFQPSHGNRRVYIIDEAHQLSKAAFNALLKTIEEPPPHVLFVFCTTETHQMMATVRDRCQRVAMRSPGADTLMDVLRRVTQQEGIDADDAALRAVARAAQGSFRNALGTLEMLTTTFGTSFTRDAVLSHLGVVAEETLFEAVDAIIAGDAGAALRLVDDLVQQGVDLDQFARSLAEHLRGVLLELHGVGDAAGVGDPARLTEQAARADELRVLAAIDCIADAATRIRVGSDARISLETALVRASQGLGLPLLAVRLASLEQKVLGGYGLPVSGASPAASPTASSPAPPTAPAVSARSAAAAAPVTAGAATAGQPGAASQQPALALTDAQFADSASWWAQVVQRVAASPAYRAALESLELAEVDGRRVVLRQRKPGLVSAKFNEQLVQQVREVTGRSLAVEVRQPSPPSPSGSASPAADHPKSSDTTAVAPLAPAPDLTSDAGVANVISMFDAVPVAPGGTRSDD
ncbi:MAG: dnaX [Thermoleophilia bacterium]|nr:dnaX [Thermoleophilia bacterium]